ncbi:MAG: hypothetical protein U9P71_05865 [Campylobacterota bacterium]|nr:hypothetical protein [Campylobacterota bacterium]
MPTHSKELFHFLVKHYDMNAANATIMIEEEWDYVEEHLELDGGIEIVAKELVDIYMVA